MRDLADACPACSGNAELVHENNLLLYCCCESCRNGGYWLLPSTLHMLTDGRADEGELTRRQNAARVALTHPKAGMKLQPLHPVDLG
jgi:hypothetical protein